MHHLEMEEDDEHEIFLSDHPNNNNNDRGHAAPPPSAASSSSGCSRIWLVAGTIVGFWVLAYRVSLSKEQQYIDSSSPPTPTPPVASPATTPSGINSPPTAADTTPPAPAPTPKTPPKKKQLLYSKMATIVPDPEHLPLDEATLQKTADQWGSWHFWDGEEASRPASDYCAAYENRDIPGDEFPDDAWQCDAVYVNHLLDDAEQLIARTMEAIWTEYGWGKPQTPEGLSERLKLFHWTKLNLAEAEGPPPQYSKRGNQGGGGWTTERSQAGLVRRILHACMTNDKFTVVLGGHSAAAGHGNHFRQSYLMQFHRIVAPVFARLGVQLVTRNLSQGGLGTIQNALGMGSLYGDEIDLLLWDSGTFAVVYGVCGWVIVDLLLYAHVVLV